MSGEGEGKVADSITDIYDYEYNRIRQHGLPPIISPTEAHRLSHEAALVSVYMTGVTDAKKSVDTA